MDETLEVLAKLNPWWNQKNFEIGISRDRYISKLKKYIPTREIVVLTGVRRSGKTTLIYQLIHDLINNQNIDPEKILFVNCDEPELNATDNLLKKVMDTYRHDVCSEEYTATYLQVSEGVRLEIFDLEGQTKPAARTESDVGVKHIAFRVKNVKAHAKMMEDAGAKIVMPYTELKDFAAKAVLFKDPDGNVIEFCEPL